MLAAGQLIVVDTGPGSWANMADAHLPVSRLTAILLSHFHSDHIGDLGEVVTQTWMKGRSQPLDVYGPPGVEEVVAGFKTAYALDHRCRVEQFGEQNMPILSGTMHPLSIQITAPDTSVLIIDRNGLKVTAFLVDHAPATPAYGYRFEYKGRVLVISGDTAKSDNLVKYASDADVLIHEVVAKSLVLQGTMALSKAGGHERMVDMARKVLSGHTAADEVVEEARKAHVKKLVFTHIAPSLPPFLPNFVLRWLFFDKQDGGFEGPIIFGTDGLWIEA